MTLIDKDLINNYKYRIIVAGSRHFNNYKSFCKSVKEYLKDNGYKKEDICFISGNAKTGADALIIELAIIEEYDYCKFPARWEDLDAIPCIVKKNTTGRDYNILAGHNRNKEMADVGTDLIAFWNMASTGTKNMVNLATKNKLKHKVILIVNNDIL